MKTFLLTISLYDENDGDTITHALEGMATELVYVPFGDAMLISGQTNLPLGAFHLTFFRETDIPYDDWEVKYS